jgi:hypothetical protein
LAQELQNLTKKGDGKRKKSSLPFHAILWNLRKFADSSNGSEKVEKAVWLAAHIGMFPIEVFFLISANLRKFHFMSERFGSKIASGRFSSQSWASFMIQTRHELP